jgi:hypothetical protein
MSDSNTISTTFNVSYDVPRVLLSAPGRQNRAGNGLLRITPGVTEPFEFIFGNHDGVKLNLMPFTIKLVFWRNENITDDIATLGQTEVILTKQAEVDDPYSARALVVLADWETLLLGQRGARSLRWAVYMCARDGSVYPCTVSSGGARYGTVQLDLTSGLPTAEMIRGPADQIGS